MTGGTERFQLGKLKLHRINEIEDLRTKDPNSEGIRVRVTRTVGTVDRKATEHSKHSEASLVTKVAASYGVEEVSSASIEVTGSYTSKEGHRDTTEHSIEVSDEINEEWHYPAGFRSAYYCLVVDLKNGMHYNCHEEMYLCDSKENGTIEEQVRALEGKDMTAWLVFTKKAEASTDIQPLVKHGDIVYLKSSQGFYLAEPCSGTYCAAASKVSKHKQAFKIQYVRCTDKAVASANDRVGIQLVVASNNGYIGDCNRLYNATTGSAKYDYNRQDNSKQFWKLDYHWKDPSKSLRYNTEVVLLDMYVDSYLCVNTESDCRKYLGGADKVWVEGKYQRHLLPNFDKKFIFEKGQL